MTLTSTELRFVKTVFHMPHSPLVLVGILTAPGADTFSAVLWPATPRTTQRHLGLTAPHMLVVLVIPTSSIRLDGIIGLFASCSTRQGPAGPSDNGDIRIRCAFRRALGAVQSYVRTPYTDSIGLGLSVRLE